MTEWEPPLDSKCRLIFKDGRLEEKDIADDNRYFYETDRWLWITDDPDGVPVYKEMYFKHEGVRCLNHQPFWDTLVRKEK